jgi:hypothetical protein
MAIVELNINRFGTAATPKTVTAADTALMANDGLTHLYVINGTGSVIACTVYEKRPCNYGHNTVNFIFNCGANTTTRLGTFRKDRYNRDDGKLEITFAATVTAHGVQIVPEEGRI